MLIKTLIIFILFFINNVYSDIVFLKNGNEKKGVILEQYSDRIVFSDIEGKNEILRSEIKDIKFDSNSQNNFYLGKKYENEKKYTQALEYYETALRENSDSKIIQDAILYVRGIIFRQKEDFHRENLKRFKETNLLAMSAERKHKFNEKIEKEPINYEKEIEQVLGLNIKKSENGVEITSVRSGSPAYLARLRSGDEIIGIWDNLIKYDSLEKIQKMLLENKIEYSEVKIILQRRIVILRGDKYWFSNNFKIIDGKLKFIKEGLIIYDIKKDGRSYLAGLENNDFVIKIEGIDTNYMTMKTIKEKLKGEEASKLEFIILRHISLRKK